MVIKICQYCGKEFITTNQNKNQPCCNRECKSNLIKQSKTKICECCNKEFVAEKHNTKYCSVECRIKSVTIYGNVVCKNCNTEFKFETKNKNIYCSKKCYSEYTQKQNKLKPINIKSYSNVYFINCKQCNKLFTSQKENTYYCSSTCGSSFNYQNSKPIYKRECNICNTKFETKSAIQKQCSNNCSNLFKKQKRKEQKIKQDNNKHIKRARKFNVEYESGININKLLKRDGNKCLICNKEVLKKNVSGYHKDNATIGHIISLSNGGNHSMDNVQLEFMECNVKKGNRDTI